MTKPYYETELGRLYLGDCLEIMPRVEPNIDMICCDPPYGTTACKWDSIIPLEPMWEQLKRLIKPNGAIVMTASQPFTTILISSNMKMFKYCWVWNKISKSDHFNAKNKPLKQHEDITVFSFGMTANCSKNKMIYLPQNVKAGKRTNSQNRKAAGYMGSPRPSHKITHICHGSNYPSSIIEISNADRSNIVHPTQKPVALMEYLIKTYTNESEIVLDFAAGSGTTGIACECLNRRWIMIEKEERYAEISAKRIEVEAAQLKLW